MSPRSMRTAPSLSLSTSMECASDKALPKVPDEMGGKASAVLPDSARTLPTSWRAPSQPKSPSIHLYSPSSHGSDLFSPASMRSTRQPDHHANTSNDSTPTNASFPRYRHYSDHPSTSALSVPLEEAPISNGPVGLKKKPSGRKMLGMGSKRASLNPVSSSDHAKKPSVALLGRLPSVMRRNASDNDLGSWNRRRGKMARTPSSSALNDGNGSVCEDSWEKVERRVMTRMVRRDDGLDADQGIGLPFNVEHDLHVSHTLDGLPPPWIKSLRDQGLSDQDLMLITAANRQRHASTVPLATLPRDIETPKRRSPLLAPPLEGLKTDHRERMKASASPESPKTAAAPISPTAAPSAWSTLKRRSRSSIRLSVSASGGSSPQESSTSHFTPVEEEEERGPRLSLQLQDFRQLKVVENEEGSDWANGLLAALGEQRESSDLAIIAQDDGQDGEIRSPSSARFIVAKRIPVPKFLDEPQLPHSAPEEPRASSPQLTTATTPLSPPPSRALNQRRQSKLVDVPITPSPRNSFDGQSFGIEESSSDGDTATSGG